MSKRTRFDRSEGRLRLFWCSWGNALGLTRAGTALMYLAAPAGLASAFSEALAESTTIARPTQGAAESLPQP